MADGLTHRHIAVHKHLALCGYDAMYLDGPEWAAPTTCFGCITNTWMAESERMSAMIVSMSRQPSYAPKDP